MANPQLWSQLQTSFIEDLKTTRHLKELLDAERKALEARDYKAFQQQTASKQQLLTSLQNQIQQRHQLFAGAGFNSEEAVLKVAEQQAPTIAKAWRQLASSWEECQEMNAVNERIAQRTRLVVNQMLDMLRGGSQQQKLYTSSGDTRQSGLGRSITSA